jgi:signal transduction histidine kinase/ActR/RegA family two-component response regulator
VLLTAVILTAVTTIAVRTASEDQHEDAHERRTAEVAHSLEQSVGELGSTLDVLADIPLSPPGSPALFEQTAEPLVSDVVRFLGVAEVHDGQMEIVASVGDDSRVGETLAGARRELVERALDATGFVTAVLQHPEGTRLGYATASPDRERVVIREVSIDPATPAATVGGQVLEDIHVAVYAGSEARAGQLVLSTSDELPLVGDIDLRPLDVGADDWLLVTQGRQELLSFFTRMAPWATLVAGLIVTLLLTALIESIGRRRSFALDLVDARTAELQATLAEQARLEAEARQASAEASAANRSKSEFLSRMSHELRTPLSAVIGFAQLLELDDLTDLQRESVEQIQKGGRHLLDLINEVLDITRIETGDFTLSSEPVLASEILADATDLMRPVADTAKIHLVGDRLTGCDVHVFADRQRLKQILLNLLANAVKYNRIGGTVAVSCSSTRDLLRLNVTDTGPGIPPESLGLLFEPFERLGAEHGTVEGTGIGLALSRRLAEAMGGRLDVDTALGRGSTFWIELPVVEAPVERLDRLGPATSVPVEVPVADTRQRILYIEDNLSNLKLVERVLEARQDIELIAAMQGRLGLELARQHAPALVLLDLHLPDVDGDEVLRELRDDPATASVPVVILSAEASPNHIQRVLAAGAHSYLTKPLDVRALLRTIDQLVGDRD